MYSKIIPAETKVYQMDELEPIVTTKSVEDDNDNSKILLSSTPPFPYINQNAGK